MPSSGLLVQEWFGAFWSEFSKGSLIWLRDWRVSHEERLKSCDTSLGKAWGISPMYINTWGESVKKMEPDSFQWPLVTGNGHELKHESFYLNIFFLLWDDWALAQSAHRGCILWDIQKLFRHGPGQLALGGPIWDGRLHNKTFSFKGSMVLSALEVLLPLAPHPWCAAASCQ